ncbi:TOBE domain-containing protein, partial [Nitratireductor sp. GCM10026969]|uniref:TOBE domain-containing protein n=1 Tax=Nitratireductor sp. GCM10026969 TaxID=3252645 RepID=UPI00361131D2
PRLHASLSLHPGDLSLTGDDPQAGLAAEVLRVRYRGDHFRAELALGADPRIVLPVNLPQRVPVGQKVAVALRDGWVLPDPNLAQAQAA